MVHEKRQALELGKATLNGQDVLATTMQSFASYGKYYDIIYADKEYEKECDFLEGIFKKYAGSLPKTTLDAGCGTGSHAVSLGKRGFNITGIDASETMIRIARAKAERNGVNIDFHVMDLRKLKLNKKFDACISMFTVVGYIVETEDVEKVFRNIRKHLNTHSLFIFDFWYGPAVLHIRPSPRMKNAKKDDVQVIRFAEPHLNTLLHLCEVKYSLIVTKKKKIIDELEETHTVRYFFPKEIQHILEEANFRLLRLCPFRNLNAEPTENDWNVVAIAQAV